MLTNTQIVQTAETLVADHRACWVSHDASGREYFGATYGSDSCSSVEEAEGELEALREEIAQEFVGTAVTVGDGGPDGTGYYAVLLVGGQPVPCVTYRLHHAGSPLRDDEDAYAVGDDGTFFDLDEAIAAAESLDETLGWDIDVVRVEGSDRRIAWG